MYIERLDWMISIIACVSYIPLGTRTQLVRDSFHRLEHAVREVVEIRRDLSL